MPDSPMPPSNAALIYALWKFGWSHHYKSVVIKLTALADEMARNLPPSERKEYFIKTGRPE